MSSQYDLDPSQCLFEESVVTKKRRIHFHVDLDKNVVQVVDQEQINTQSLSQSQANDQADNPIEENEDSGIVHFREVASKLLDPEFHQLHKYLPTKASTAAAALQLQDDDVKNFSIWGNNTFNPSHITEYLNSINNIKFADEDVKNLIIRRITMLVSSNDIKFDSDWHASERDLHKFCVFAMTCKEPLNYKLIESSLQYIPYDDHIFVDSIAENVVNRHINPASLLDLFLLCALVLVRDDCIAYLVSNFLREKQVYAKYYGTLKSKYPYVYDCLQQNITAERSKIIGVDINKYLLPISSRSSSK